MTGSQPLHDLALDTRTGLPDALRVLLEELPRTDWQVHPGFDGLIRFWLDRHMMFRHVAEKLKTDTRLRLDGKNDPAVFKADLARFGSGFVSDLHGHHRIEDVHYFPVLSERDGRISSGFDILDRDHHDLDGFLNHFVEGANTVLRTDETDLVTVGRFHDQLERLEQHLGRHLEDEEDLVVPVLLKYGSSGLG